MPTYGPRFPGTVESIAPGANAWTGLDNVKASNGLDASVAPVSEGDTTQFLRATNFGFTIPANETIVGIEFHARGAAGAEEAHSTRILKVTTPVGDLLNNANTIFRAQPNFPVTATDGGPTELHGLAWTPAEINASTFGFQMKGFLTTDDGLEFFVDYMSITVYTAARDAGLLRPNQVLG